MPEARTAASTAEHESATTISDFGSSKLFLSTPRSARGVFLLKTIKATIATGRLSVRARSACLLHFAAICESAPKWDL
jgi:hypothetical protein